MAVNLRFMISWEILVHAVYYHQNLFNFFLFSFHFIKLQMSGVYMNILFSDTELKDLT